MPYGYNRPQGYARTRAAILTRDPECQLHLDPACERVSVEVDAIVPESQGGAHVTANLQGVCAHCHSIKTEAERRAGIARRSRKREPRRHPGIVDD